MANVVQMPMASQTMESGKIVKWLKKEGEQVKRGDQLVEIETDKAVMAIESFFDGILLKILTKEGDVVPVLQPIAVIGKSGESIDPGKVAGGEILSAQAAPPTSTQPVSQAPAQKTMIPQQTIPSQVIPSQLSSALVPAPPGNGGKIRTSPAARRLARELGVDIHTVRGTGPGGRIVRADVYSAAQSVKTPEIRQIPAEISVGVKSIPMSKMRLGVARTVIHSKKTAAEFYVTFEVDMTTAIEKQKQFSLRGEEAVGVKVSLNDLLIKASALALRSFPLVNSRLDGETVLTPNFVNVGFVVGLEEGMVIPVIEQADIRSVIDIARESKRLISNAKEGRIAGQAHGTFTISNMGMFGVEEFTAIIHQPESAILAVGAVKEKPVVINSGIHIRPMMNMTLTADHRILDGVIAAKFLARIKEILETGKFE